MAKDLEELKKETPTGQLSKAQVEELKMGLIKDAEVLELLGLSKEPIVSPRLGLMNGLQVYIKGDDKGDFAYEAKIPFKAFRIDKAAVKVLGLPSSQQDASSKSPKYYTRWGWCRKYGLCQERVWNGRNGRRGLWRHRLFTTEL